MSGVNSTIALFDAFLRLARSCFWFLVTDYGYRLHRTETRDELIARVVFKGPNAAVDVALSTRDNWIAVNVIRLIGDAIPSPISPQRHWFDVDHLLNTRSQSWQPRRKRWGDWMTEDDLEPMLLRYAEALREHAADALRGEAFDELEQLYVTLGITPG